jgi:predicted GTPase
MVFGDIHIELADVVEISMFETMLADKDRRVRFVLTAML